MSRKAFIGTLLVAGLGAIGYGAFRMLKEQSRLLESYCWKIKNVIVRRIKTDDVSLTIVLLLKNQSDIDVVLTKFSMDVLIDNQKVGVVRNKGLKIEWKARSVSSMEFDFNFNPKIIIGDFSKATNLVTRVLWSPEDVEIGLKGSVSASHSFLRITDIPIDYSMSLKSINEDGEKESAYECKITQDE